MDTLIYLPFSLWGLNPFVSKNLNYVFERPSLKDIEIYNSFDYGLILRKNLIKADSLPISTIYSVQFPNDNYSQYGIGFSRFIKDFLFSFNYDYNNVFKQGSIGIDYKKFELNYFEIFKLDEHLQFFYLEFSNFFKLNYQILNNNPLFFAKILSSKFIYSNSQRETYLNLAYRKDWLYLNAGAYYNFLKEKFYPNYELYTKLKFIKIISKFQPMQILDSIYIMQDHSIDINYNFLRLGYSYIASLIPKDKANFDYGYVHTIKTSLNFKFFRLFIQRNFNTPIEWLTTLNSHYDYYWRKDILISPYVKAMYIENQFTEPIEDIFISSIGISFNLFGGTYVNFNYSSNFYIQSLWNYNSYGIFLRISLED